MKKIFIILGLFTTMFLTSCATTLKVPDVDIYAENVPVTVTVSETDCKQISLKRVSDYGAVKAAERDGYDSIVCLGQATSQSLYQSLNSYDTYDTTKVDFYSNNYNKIGNASVQTKSTHYYTETHSRNSMSNVYLFFKGDVKQRFKDTERYQVLYVTDKERYKSLAKKAYAEEYELWKQLVIESGLSLLTCFIATPIIPIEIIRYNVYKPKD